MKLIDTYGGIASEWETTTMLAALIEALILVESEGDDGAIGDGGLAVGCLQIHPVMVEDVNRILGWDAYGLEDRRCRRKSIGMAATFFAHYVTAPRLGRDTTLMDFAVAWHGGPDAPFAPSEADLAYWERVRFAMESMA